ncbi:hypothetical protein PDJAM_G00166910 [Pangasius djambal]|uniref:Uncharacterized protein n=1 Tax=Pangasius djambal TaxID=1691987 RepID=A0ACC5ZM24_9TELE|nr:hypothetical protein [Pangasius djambal]
MRKSFQVTCCSVRALPFEVTFIIYLVLFHKISHILTMADFSSFDMPSTGSSENADTAELQRLIAVEQQKAQFQAQVHNFTDVCWDKCIEKPSSKLDSRTEACLVSCVERFIDTTLAITNRFTQMVQKGTH